MSDESFRRIVWSGVLLGGIAVWTFAIIGVRTVFADAPRISVWAAAERPLP